MNGNNPIKIRKYNMARKTTRNRKNSETEEEMLDKLRKKSELTRKRLLNKIERKMKALQKRKALKEEEEVKEEEERMKKEFTKEMIKHDQEAKIFYPNEEEWKNYIKQANVGLQNTHPSVVALQTADSSLQYNTTSHYEESNISEVDNNQSLGDDEESEPEVEPVSTLEAKKLLDAHIRSMNANKKVEEEIKESSYDSDTTTLAGGTNRNKEKSLNGYKVPPTKHVIYCKAKILVKQSENPTSSMAKTLGSYLTTLLKTDKSLLLFKYKDKTNTSFINRPTQIPDTPSKIKNFFYGRYRPKTEAYQMWPEMKIGINMEPEVFFEDVKCLLEDKRLGALYKKELQAEDTEEIGFFLFSNKFQDRKRQMNSISKRIQKEFNFTPMFNLRWKNAFDPTNRAKKNLLKKPRNEEAVKATYVEVVKGEEAKIVRAISKIYSSVRKEYPDLEKMRFIPAPKFTQNSGLKERYSELINRQNWYIQGIDKALTFDIATLDTKAASLPYTAREMIMRITNEQGLPIFTSIDPSWDSGYCVTFPNAYEEIARNRIADLGPYLKHLYGDMVLVKYFTPEAALRARDCTWDKKLMRAISPMDQDLDAVIQECDDIDWLKAPVNSHNTITWDNNQIPKPQAQPLFQHLPNEDQSLDTFGNESTDTYGTNTSNSNTSNQSGQKRDAPFISPDRSNMSPRKKPKSIQQTFIPETEDLTDDDAETIETLSSRMSMLETGARNMENKIDTLIGLLSNNKNLRNSTFVDSTGITSDPQGQGEVL